MQRRLEATKKLSCKYEQTAGKNCAFIASKYGDKDTLPIEIFQQFNKVTFEGKEYQTLFDIKDYLLQMYGSFKPEKSHPTHDYYKFYWKKK